MADVVDKLARRVMDTRSKVATPACLMPNLSL
jgi:hypothetical protein